MNTPQTLSVLVAVLGLTLCGRVQAQDLSWLETFEGRSTANFVTDFSPWTTSDTFESNGFASAPGVSLPPSAGSTVGFLGGYLSGNPVQGPSTPLPATLDFNMDTQNNFIFRANWIQNVANPSPDDGKRDVFGWAVRDLASGGDALLSLKFVPAPIGTPFQRDGQNYDTAVFGYTGAFWDGGTQTSDPLVGVFNRGEWIQLGLQLDTLSDTWSATINNIAGNTPITFVTGASALDMGDSLGVISLSAIWNPGDFEGIPASFSTNAGTITSDGGIVYNPGQLVTSAGANTMFFDNINATAIPEPSSTALLGCGIALWFGTRRRLKSA